MGPIIQIQIKKVCVFSGVFVALVLDFRLSYDTKPNTYNQNGVELLRCIQVYEGVGTEICSMGSESSTDFLDDLQSPWFS